MVRPPLALLALLWLAQPAYAQQGAGPGPAPAAAAGCSVSSPANQVVVNNGSNGCSSSPTTINASTGFENLPAGSTSGPSISINGAASGWYASTAGEWDYYQSTIGIPIFSIADKGPAGGSILIGSATALGFTGASSSVNNAAVTECVVGATGFQFNAGAGCGQTGILYAGGYDLGSNPVVVNTAPTIGSGFGSSPSIVASNGTAAFTLNVGTGGSATSGVVTMPTAAHGWACQVTDITTKSAAVAQTLETATTATSVTVGDYSDTMGSNPWAASDVLQFVCAGY
jgi:hypothetical protein